MVSYSDTNSKAILAPTSDNPNLNLPTMADLFGWDRIRTTSLRNRPLRLLVSLTLAISFFMFWSRSTQHHYTPESSILAHDKSLDPMIVPGYLHPGPKSQVVKCDDIFHDGELYVQPSFDIDDDMYAIVDTLKEHPMVKEHYKWAKLEVTKEVVDKTWLRMAQSSVWMEQYDAYLTVTRIVFYTQGVRHWSKMSFLRGQIHDANWHELKDHTINFRGNSVTFPRIFDIPSPYILNGGFYGPEDPRVIIEEGVQDAEPVIIFNMANDLEKKTRAMHIHRPFTNDTQILSIHGRDRRGSEKNWAPFFYSPEVQHQTPRWPNPYIHFIYEFKNLQVLKCHLLNGWCDVAYQTTIDGPHQAKHNDTHGSMRGGTNFVPITTEPGPKQSFIGFPRTHIVPGCKDGFYRPALTILTATSPNEFHFDFMSDSLDFNEEPFPISSTEQPCKDGRVLIANSISDWKGRGGDADTMTLTFSVDDYTTEVLRLQGVQRFINTLPAVSSSGAPSDPKENALHWAIPSQSVLGCSVEAATNWTIARVAEGDPKSPGLKIG